MKNLVEFLEQKLNNYNENKLSNFSLKITNTEASINNKIFNSSIDKNKAKDILMQECLGKTSENIDELNNSMIELKFNNHSSWEVIILSKIVNDKIITSLTKLFRNEEKANDIVKSAVKEKGFLYKTKTMEDMINLLYFIIDSKVDFFEPKEEPKEEEPKEEEPKEEEPKEEEPKEEEPKEEEPK